MQLFYLMKPTSSAASVRAITRVKVLSPRDQGAIICNNNDDIIIHDDNNNNDNNNDDNNNMIINN